MARKSKIKAKTKPAADRRLGTALWVVALAIATVGIFWLPWHVISSTPVVGEAYVLGFSNRTAILALGLSIFVGAAACYFGSRRPAAYKWFSAEPRIFPPWNEARLEYSILVAVCALTGSFAIFWSNYLVDPAWCESRSFIYDMDLLALGQKPYTDFMCNYGPATIYLPFWLSNLTGGSLSFEQSYAAILVLFEIAGFMALFAILRSIDLPVKVRGLVLGLTVIQWCTQSMGLQYTPLRFLIVPASLVFLDTVSMRRLFPSGLAAALAVAVCLAISPEMGIAGTFAVAAYGFVLLLRRAFVEACSCIGAAILVFCAMLVGVPGYLDSVLAFSSGGNNFPIYPDVHNICMIAVCLYVLPRLIASAIGDAAEKRAPLALGLAVGGGMLLPAAFGRCDPGHVVINGMTPALVMFGASAAAGKVLFRTWTAAYAAIFVILVQVSFWTQYIPNFKFAIGMHEYYEAHPETVASWKSAWDKLRQASPYGKDLHWSKVLPCPEGLEQLTSKGRVLLASGNEGTLWLARFLLLQKDPPREYFHAYSQGAATPAQIARKVRQDQGYQFIIVPQSAVATLSGQIDLAAYQQWINSFLSKLFLFPVDSEIRNPPYLPDTEYVKQMIENYQIIGRYDSFVILSRKQG